MQVCSVIDPGNQRDQPAAAVGSSLVCSLSETGAGLTCSVFGASRRNEIYVRAEAAWRCFRSATMPSTSLLNLAASARRTCRISSLIASTAMLFSEKLFRRADRRRRKACIPAGLFNQPAKTGVGDVFEIPRQQASRLGRARPDDRQSRFQRRPCPLRLKNRETSQVSKSRHALENPQLPRSVPTYAGSG